MSKKSPKNIEQVNLDDFNQEPSSEQKEKLVETLKQRFKINKNRHFEIKWSEISEKLIENPEKLRSLYAMEITGGEPDVIGQDKETGEFIFVDCSKESPKGRRSICYDGAGQQEREKKGVYPSGNAIDMASAMGIEVLDEYQYRKFQELGSFDTKTSSWIQTPSDIRELGGALFADRRYDHVFVYHNSAPSFYSARGFRGSLRI